ncbi:hypothetical protein NG819_20315 [Pseudarthrobacter sp. Fe7]|nr:hypothetical protein NG819_20315 [Pseudarthrobacter sp. Fe7]
MLLLDLLLHLVMLPLLLRGSGGAAAVFIPTGGSNDLGAVRVDTVLAAAAWTRAL